MGEEKDGEGNRRKKGERERKEKVESVITYQI